VLKKWFATPAFSWWSWWMFHPVMTQLLVVAAEAVAVPKVAAAAPAATVAARTADRRVRSFLTELADMTTP